MDGKLLAFYNELQELQDKHGVYISSESKEIIDLNWDEEEEIVGSYSYLTLNNKQGNTLAIIDWDKEIIKKEDWHE